MKRGGGSGVVKEKDRVGRDREVVGEGASTT